MCGGFLQVDPKERRKLALSFGYEGDPDLYPIRSWESKFLVRVLYYICLWINTQVTLHAGLLRFPPSAELLIFERYSCFAQFRRDLRRIYYEDSVLGGIARQIMCPPQQMYHFEKRHTPDGYSRRVHTTLPPRISLRWCASYYYTMFMVAIYLSARMLEYSFFNCCFMFVSLYVVYVTINSIFYPMPIPNTEDESDYYYSSGFRWVVNEVTSFFLFLVI